MCCNNIMYTNLLESGHLAVHPWHRSSRVFYFSREEKKKGDNNMDIITEDGMDGIATSMTDFSLILQKSGR